jgi:hypothetical protein
MPSLWVTTSEEALVPLETEGYAKEGDFQRLLADNPAVLASAVDPGGDSSQWLLVDRELPIKADESDTGTWSLDHLFIAADAVPVLVEVKRSSNPAARREVVAQMLDYAASFAADWSAERLRGRFEQRTSRRPGTSTIEMDAFFTSSGLDDEEQLWDNVQTNIDAGKIRLLFVADQLSPTLVRVIDYLKAQLRTAEVLGVEVVRHAPATAGGPIVYQPVVHGRNSPIAQRKAPPQPRSRDDFAQAVRTHLGDPVLSAVSSLIEKAEGMGAYVTLGTSEQAPGLSLNFHTNGGPPVYSPFRLNSGPKNKLIIRMGRLRTHPAFQDEEVRDDVLDRVVDAASTPIQGNRDANPWVPLSSVANPGVVDKLVGVLAWIKATADAGPDGPATASGESS